MSRAFVSLLKVSLKQTFDLRRKNKKNVSFIVPIVLILTLGSLLSGVYGFIFAMTFKEVGEPIKPTLYVMAGFASMLALTTCIPKVKSTLFGGNDYEMLASMPIKRSYIIFTKFISIYLIEFLFSFVCVFPSIVVISVLEFSFYSIIEGVLLIVFSPVIPLLLAGLIGMLIGVISDRFRFGNIITITLYAALLIFVMFFSTSMSSSQNPSDVVSGFSILIWINPSTMLLTLPIGINWLTYLIVNIVVLAFFVVCFASCYDYFHFLITSTAVSNRKITKEQKVKGRFKALFVLDFKRYFHSKTYLLNTITGGILTVVLMVAMYFSLSSVEEVDIISELKPYAVFFSLMILWCVGIAVPSAVAINYEGKSFWQVKTLPINFKEYAYSKVLLSYIVLAPFVLVSSILLILFSDLKIITIITTILLPQMYLLMMSFLAFLINTICYKLNWSSEIEAVKNSKGMVFSMLIDFGFTIILSASMIYFGLSFSVFVGCLIALIITVISLVVVWILFSKNVAQNIAKIEI